MTQATLNVIDYYIQNDFCRGGNGEDETQLWEERRLVAAAPDLLAALEALLADALALGLADSHLSGSAIEARAAITKAKGA